MDSDTQDIQGGRALSAPGSREPSPAGSALTGFDPSRDPTNAMIAAGERAMLEKSERDPEGKWWGYAKKVWQAMEAARAPKHLRDETGWLIEKQGPNAILYATATIWTPHLHRALRFARQEDAQAFADAFSVPRGDNEVRGWLEGYTRIAEHAWS